ncbi:MAG: YbaN family protein [Chloroflexota bacterium]
MSPAPDRPATRLPLAGARPVRAVFFVLGTVFLGLAALGIVVPVLPTTPFVLLAAACYLRASTRVHDRLVRSRTFGPTIVAWQEHRAIPPRAKALAIVMVTVTFVVSVVFVVDSLEARAGLAGLGAILVVWLVRRPSWTPPPAAGEPPVT